MRHIALLRSINVGGHNRLPMAELRALCADKLGWTEVKTYIQSGNVVFASPEPADRATLAASLSEAIAAAMGFTVPVIVRTHGELAETLAISPFPEAEHRHLAFALLSATPAPAAVAALNHDRSPGDRMAVVGDCVYLHFPAGTARSKLTVGWLEKQLGVEATVRNWNTAHKLLALSAP